ncbi:MAG: hypothetical protein E2O88_11345 [Bacteroidetes bacterium]|nr:MAG: hypothetical protein E2O88_11345 [Bacteroidota bacterium]
MRSLLIEPQYLPCIEYFAVIDSVEKVVLECHENYLKQTYRNRCRIMTAQGPFELYLPVLQPGGKIKMKDVKIDHGQKWVKDHWRTINAAYGNAPFFEHFGFLFEEVFHKKFDFLLDLNIELLMLCRKLLDINIPFEQTSCYLSKTGADMVDWRSKIHPKKALENNPFYKPCNYNQIFGKKFVGNLSIIDLLFCEGVSARQVLDYSKP